MSYNVCVVTVTYGNRFKLLEKVINSCVREGVYKIIIVDNASFEESRKELRKIEKTLDNKLTVIYLKENMGSAGGFKIGLKEAYRCKNCEFIYLLDDDNVPLKGTIKKLVNKWKDLKIENKNRKIALVSYREDKEICNLIKSGKDYRDWIKRTDYFLGFHIMDISSKIFMKIKKIFGKDFSKTNSVKNLLPMPYAPYGGLFFHKEILKEIGYPNDIFFTYADDHEFTYRIVLKGGKIFLVPESIVIDIDKSWNKNTPGFVNIIPSFLKGKDSYRVYLAVRNRIIFEKMYFRKNKVIYYINKVTYLTYLAFMAVLTCNLQRFKLILEGIKDGESFRSRNIQN